MAGLAFCLGSAAAWSQSGLYRPLVGAGLLVLCLLVEEALVRWVGRCWAWSAVPALLIVGMIPGLRGWDWRSIWLPIALGLALWPRAGLECCSERSLPRLGWALAYGVLFLAVIVRAAPVWCLLAVFAAPSAIELWRQSMRGMTAAPKGSHRSATSRLAQEFAGALADQLIVGYLIEGLVR